MVLKATMAFSSVMLQSPTSTPTSLSATVTFLAMVRESHGLIALAAAYYNVGRLAGYQAEEILARGKTPGDMEVLGLDRFTVLVNIDTARELELYPPMLLLRYAEIVGGPQPADG